MKKSLLLSSLILIILFLTVPVVYLSSQSISLEEQKVIYQLPYPGLLPDHPLYFLKQTRDKVMEFTTRDTIKKARLYLSLSDKYMSMAIELGKKGKDQLAYKTLSQGEEYFLKIPPLLRTSKKQGVSAPDDLTQKLLQSNAKHREVITDVMKDLPQGQVENLEKVLELNAKALEELKKVK